MRMEWWINDNGWKQVSYEEYESFNGEKEPRSSTWRYALLNAILLPYRYL